MNSIQKTLATCGGAVAAVVLAAGYCAWSAYDSKVGALEGDDENVGLHAVEEMAETLSRKPIYPCADSVKAIESNTAKVADWTVAARRLASRGDRPVRTMTEAQFKTDLVADAKRLAALPGSADGRLTKPDFAFGPFRPYIAESKMPETDRLAELVRRWDDVQLVVETLADAGVGEIVDVAFGSADDAAAAKAKEPAKGAARRPARRPPAPAKAKAKDGKSANDAEGPKSFSYVFTFSARPPAFVKAINALGTCERFVIVDSVAVARTEDPIADALGGAEKKDAPRAGGRRPSRRPAAEQKAEKPDEAKAGVVTDPQTDAPLKVTIALTVCDFGLLADDDDDEGKADVKKADEKKKEDAK